MAKNRVLVIEDQEDLVAIYETMLGEAGYEVNCAYTGEEGVAEFQANGADLVLLDMTLPEMHGAQVMQEIRSMSPSVPIVIVTGEVSEQLRRQCERLGVHEYLMKPPEPDAIIEAVERALREESRDDYEVIKVRLPKRVIATLTEIDQNLERAIARLVDETAGQNRVGKKSGATG